MARAQLERATREGDRFVDAAHRAEPARVVVIADRIAWVVLLRRAKVPLGFGGVSERAFQHADVHVQVRILWRVLERAGEVLIRDVVPPFCHLDDAVRHQSAAVLRTLLGHVEPQRLFGAPDDVSSMRAICVRRQDDEARRHQNGGRLQPNPNSRDRDDCILPIERGQRDRPRGGERQSDERKEHAMIVHHLRKRHDARRRHQGAEEPEDAEGNRTRLAPAPGRDPEPQQRADEHEADDDAIVERIGERRPVGVGAQIDRQDERIDVVKDDERLRPEIGPPRRAARRKRGRQPQAADEDRHARDEHRPRVGDEPGDISRLEQLAHGQLALEKRDVQHDERRGDDALFLGAHREGGGNRVQAPPARDALAREHQQRDDDAQRRKNFRPRDDVIHRLGVRRVQRVPRGSEQRNPPVPGVWTRAIHQPPVEHQHRGALQREQREAGRMKRPRVEAAGHPVIQRERRRQQRAVALVRRQRAERLRIDEEARDVVNVADEVVIADRVVVVEMEVVMKVVRVRGDERRERQTARDRVRPSAHRQLFGRFRSISMSDRRLGSRGPTRRAQSAIRCSPSGSDHFAL